MQPSSLLARSKFAITNTIKAGIIIISILGVIGFFMKSIQGDTRKVPSMAEGLIRLEQKQEMKMKEIEAYDKKNKTHFAQISRGMTCKVSGYLCGASYGFDRTAFKDSYIGGVASLALLPLQNPPASGMRYVAEKFQDAGVVPKALAAESSLNRGVGFASIDPLLPIWKVFRSVSLMLLVVLTLLSGFFVMFRYKVNAQTSIAIENAIPKLLVTMLLIVFSFAIAGFVIDLMYISIGAIMSFASQIQFGNMKIDQANLYTKYFDAGPDDLLGLYMGDLDVKHFCTGADFCREHFGTWAGLQNVLWKLPEALLSIAGGPLELIFRLVGGLIAMHFIMQPVTVLVKSLAPTVSLLPGGVGASWPSFLPELVGLLFNTSGFFIVGAIITALLLNVVIGIGILLAVLFQALVLFKVLITTYIKILLLIVFAPVLILSEAIPGGSAFKDWFRSLLAEVMTFPILIGIFLIGSVLIFAITEGLTCGITGPLAPKQDCMLIQLPFLRGFEAESFGVILGMALLFMMPDLMTKTKKMINPKESSFPDFSLGTFFNGMKPMAGYMLGAGTGLLSLTGFKRGGLSIARGTTRADMINRMAGASPAMKVMLKKLGYHTDKRTEAELLEELLKK